MPNTEFKNFSLAKIIGDELNQQFDLDNYQQMDEWELSAKGLLSEQDILDLYLKHSALELTDDESFDEPMVFEGINPNYLKEWICLPLRFDDNSIDIAIATPYDIDAIKMHWKHMFKLDVHLSLARRSIIERSIEDLYFNIDISDNLSAFSAESLKDIAQEAPIVRLVNDLFSRAIEMNASDIHIEPSEDKLDVRFRIDGILQSIMQPPLAHYQAIASRLKLIGGLNIAEHRLPQDGRTDLKIGKARIDVRISTLPMMFGESIVMRILRKDIESFSLKNIGMSDNVQDSFKHMLNASHGMILVVGPTGSGKTTSLYCALNEINSGHKKIITIEDPIEYRVKGVTQIQVKPSIDLTFAKGLRSMVRQDPDVILVGEIRDTETADIAIHAALTGHLVLSTLHTNDAAGAITRLQDMGLDSYLISSALIGVMSQRLVRKICSNCSGTGEDNFKKCRKCAGSGYSGRTGIYEFLAIDKDIQSAINDNADSNEINQIALKNGMTSLNNDAKLKVAAGITTEAEIHRVSSQK